MYNLSSRRASPRSGTMTVDLFVKMSNSPTLVAFIVVYIVAVWTLNIIANYVTKHLSVAIVALLRYKIACCCVCVLIDWLATVN